MIKYLFIFLFINTTLSGDCSLSPPPNCLQCWIRGICEVCENGYMAHFHTLMEGFWIPPGQCIPDQGCSTCKIEEGQRCINEEPLGSFIPQCVAHLNCSGITNCEACTVNGGVSGSKCARCLNSFTLSGDKTKCKECDPPCNGSETCKGDPNANTVSCQGPNCTDDATKHCTVCQDDNAQLCKSCESNYVLVTDKTQCKTCGTCQSGTTCKADANGNTVSCQLSDPNDPEPEPEEEEPPIEIDPETLLPVTKKPEFFDNCSKGYALDKDGNCIKCQPDKNCEAGVICSIHEGGVTQWECMLNGVQR